MSTIKWIYSREDAQTYAREKVHESSWTPGLLDAFKEVTGIAVSQELYRMAEKNNRKDTCSIEEKNKEALEARVA